jgi:hypothetical protein
MPHAAAGTHLNAVASFTHNLGAMKRQASGKTGRKRNDTIEHFNIDPTSLIDGKAFTVHKATVTCLAKPDVIVTNGSQTSKQSLPHETRMEEVISDPSVCYANVNNVPHFVDLKATTHGALGTQTMVSNHEDMTLSVSTRGVHLIVCDIVKEKLFRKLKFFDKRKHGSYSTKTNTVCGMLIKLGNISAVEADHKWWDTLRSTVMRTHTDHRNNCIKAMRLRFRGTCKGRSKAHVCVLCLAKQHDLQQPFLCMQNVLSRIAIQTMRIIKHCTEGLTYLTCSRCVRIWYITCN